LTKEIHETLFQDVYGRIAQEYLPGSEDWCQQITMM
jgi:hypothetical protein